MSDRDALLESVLESNRVLEDKMHQMSEHLKQLSEQLDTSRHDLEAARNENLALRDQLTHQPAVKIAPPVVSAKEEAWFRPAAASKSRKRRIVKVTMSDDEAGPQSTLERSNRYSVLSQSSETLVHDESESDCTSVSVPRNCRQAGRQENPRSRSPLSRDEAEFPKPTWPTASLATTAFPPLPTPPSATGGLLAPFLTQATTEASQITPGQRTQKLRKINRFITLENGLRVAEYEDPPEAMDAELQAPQPKAEKRPPPITLVDVPRYDELRAVLGANDVTPLRGVKTKDGIRIFLESAADFRKTVQLMDHHQMKRFTYSLPEEKPLKVVVRGVPKHYTPQEIQDDLDAQGVKYTSVTRMGRGKEKPYDMILITTDRSAEGRKTFGIRQVLGLGVTTEPKRKSTGQSQCYRCQRFGHTQSRCTDAYRCAFCAEDHPSWECSRPRGRGLPARCFNCGGNHPSFATSCPSHPEQIRERQMAIRQQKLQASQRVPGRTYANMASSGLTPAPNSCPPAADLEAAIERVLLRLLPRMLGRSNG